MIAARVEPRDVGQVFHIPAHSSALGASIATAVSRARAISGLSLQEFFDACAKETGIVPLDRAGIRRELGYENGAEMIARVESGELIPSSMFLLVASSVSGLPLALMFDQPTTYETYRVLVDRVEAIESGTVYPRPEIAGVDSANRRS